MLFEPTVRDNSINCTLRVGRIVLLLIYHFRDNLSEQNRLISKSDKLHVCFHMTIPFSILQMPKNFVLVTYTCFGPLFYVFGFVTIIIKKFVPLYLKHLV